MIIKKRTISLRIQQLEALLRRLPMHFPKRPEIEGELARYKAGFRGEQTLDYYLSYLPEKEYFIFHDIRLSDGIHYFQMDTLLLSLKYLLIIEVKNFYGTLFFDHTFHQLIRTANGNEEAYPDPILQVKTQQNKLEKWLEINKFSNFENLP
jgi:hypothetical protein